MGRGKRGRARVLPQEAAAPLLGCLAMVGKGDLAYYRGGGGELKAARDGNGE